VNRAELVKEAEKAGVRPDAYSTEGGMPAERYVLDLESGGWIVYYSERGQRVEPVEFGTEDEACTYLLACLLKDRTTRSIGRTDTPIDTVLLRKGEIDEYAKLRQLLEERGIDIFKGSLATFFDDDVDTWFGIWVSRDGIAYEFQVRRGKGDLESSLKSATLYGWTEFVESSRDRRLQDAVIKARRFLRNSS
jgi:hypothetical protein